MLVWIQPKTGFPVDMLCLSVPYQETLSSSECGLALIRGWTRKLQKFFLVSVITIYIGILQFWIIIMVRHTWALGECNWNISRDILILPILSKARWWKFVCILCRQIFVHSTCLNGGLKILKIQFLIILNAAWSVLGFFSFQCIFICTWIH